MPEMPSRAKIEVSFQELQENYEGHDIGLEVFDERLRRLTDNANDAGGSFSEIIEPGVEALNEQWLYHDDIARITGRIYVIDGSIASELAQRWGEPDKDEQGNLSFFVEDFELCSYGIFDGPHGETIDDTRVAARIGYGFALPGSDAPMAQLILYPGESSQHVYPLPTPEAIDVRLHKTWPDKMKVVDKLLKYEDEDIDKLPRRLAAIARLLQDELVGSSDYREWLSIYVNDQLALNKVWPYVLSVSNTLYFQDDEASKDWLEMGIDGSVRLDVRKPRIEFVRAESDDSIKSMWFAELPDTRDEWEGTQIGINSLNITHVRGTRTYRSIVDIALATNEQNLAVALKSAGIPEDMDDYVVPNVRVEPTRKEHHGGDPTNINEMRMLKDEIDAMIEMVRPLAGKTYDTFEQAREVSTALTRTIGDRLIGAGIYNFSLKFEGEYALRALTLKNPARPVEPGEVTVSVDPENPFAQLQHGDNFQGTFYALHGDVLVDEDDNTGKTSYKALPRLIVDVKSSSASPLMYGGVPLVEVMVQQRAMISLDGTVDITIPSLTRYEADRQARVRVAEELGNHEITRRVNRLYAAFSAETDSGYQDLKNVGDIRRIARYIESGDSASVVVFEALSSMLMNRSIMASGSSDSMGDGDIRFVDGIVADISMTTFENEQSTGPFMIVLDKQDGEYHTFRISSIESLAF